MAKAPSIQGVPVFHEEVWVYAGRVLYKGVLHHRFFKDAGRGDESIYKKTDNWAFSV